MKELGWPAFHVRGHEALEQCFLLEQSLRMLESLVMPPQQLATLPTSTESPAVYNAKAAVQAWKASASLESLIGRALLEEYRARRQILDEEAASLSPLNEAVTFLQKDRLHHSLMMLDVREAQARNRITDTYLEYVEHMQVKLEASRGLAKSAQQRREDEAARRLAAMKAMEDDILRGERERDERSRRNVALLQEQEAARVQRQHDEEMRRQQEAILAQHALAKQTTDFERELRDRELSLQQRTAQRDFERRTALEELLRAEVDVRSRLDQRRSTRDDELAMAAEHCTAEEQLLRQRLEERRRADEEAAALLKEHIAAEEALIRQRLRDREQHRVSERNELIEDLARQEATVVQRMEQTQAEERRRHLQQLQGQELALLQRQQQRAAAEARSLEQQMEFLRLQEEKYRSRLAHPNAYHGLDVEAPPPYCP